MRGIEASALSVATNVPSDHGGLLRPTELRDVGAGGEDPIASGDDYRAGRVASEGLGGCLELCEQCTRECVDLGVVEGDDGDAVIASLDTDERGFVGHGGGP